MTIALIIIGHFVCGLVVATILYGLSQSKKFHFMRDDPFWPAVSVIGGYVSMFLLLFSVLSHYLGKCLLWFFQRITFLNKE